MLVTCIGQTRPYLGDDGPHQSSGQHHRDEDGQVVVHQIEVLWKNTTD